ncbi:MULTISPECIES: sialidase family protein [unclassified Spirosoma]|uniref:sialidase family protein n=1 Tax=unclassified Spirosoma TaxID=2621999 RepID=UPI00095979E6|nr:MULTISPECIES: sialidase family protein [unclassified Spirosoma]MBN8827026.1 exo-alpha-sialidase [Spirosoma sp.]OJW74428.1 MAG: hypothetical protein BGO59_19585 [Spirosoma sp. 48-14]
MQSLTKRLSHILLLCGVSTSYIVAQPKSTTALHGVEFAYPPGIINEFSKANGQDGWAREPILRRMPDGTLLCLHMTGGPWEPNNANYTAVSRSTDNGASWSSPELLLKHPNQAVYSSELFISGAQVYNCLISFYTDSWYSQAKSFTSASQNAGKTWTEPMSLPGSLSNFMLKRGFVLSNGDWFFPVACQEKADGFTEVFNRTTFTQGKHWPFCVSGLICKPGWKEAQLFGYHKRADLGMLWEPNAIEVSPGHLVMLMRASGTSVLYRTESRDYGRTWTEVGPSDIPNGNSKIMMLKIGKQVILVGNQCKDRSEVALWVSDDGCKTWKKKIRLAKIMDMATMSKIEHNAPMICYPDGFADDQQKLLYLALEDGIRHYLLKIPYADFL